ncbi:hypothetical protein A6A06_20120 [Streptomyces sp. CB02923]|uniref:hypothetical protein n=1 Tax=Streptomyces sp. CB02923 TaxID=1718985 RepID=UPI00093E5BBD|nr:hypothetical protein [Streptomyces sp. CB02923]OKI01144.1 hypothetical protein A6A06_20120 [Streptomyces sp. CB02923]
MSTFNFHGQVSGPSNFGDGGKIEINHYGADPAEALRLAAELVRHLRTEEQPVLVARAEEVQGELERARQEQRPADQGRIRRALETLSLGLATGSSGLALAQALGHAVGL